MSEEKQLEGLGGWLILVGIGIVITPLRIAILEMPGFFEIFSNGTYAALTSPTSPYYHPLWSFILIGEIAINFCILIAWCYLAFLFFTKKKLFPKLYIAVFLSSMVIIILDALAVHHVVPDLPLFNPDTSRELLRTVVGVVIWCPYMLVSKRVKATFVN